jgi:N-acylglucosamine 2-epimerase
MFKRILHWVRIDGSGLGRPKFKGNKDVESMAVPMCILSLVHEFDNLDVHNEDLDLVEIRSWAMAKIKLHLQRDGTRVLETVGPKGEEIDGFEGRKMVPGHAIECGWFLLVEAERINSAELRQYAIKHFIENPYNYGVDEKCGGLFYFLDVDGKMLPNVLVAKG